MVMNILSSDEAQSPVIPECRIKCEILKIMGAENLQQEGDILGDAATSKVNAFNHNFAPPTMIGGARAGGGGLGSQTNI